MLHFCISSCILATLLPLPPIADVQAFLHSLSLCLNSANPDITLMNRPGSAEIQDLLALEISTFDKCIPYLKSLKNVHFSHHQAGLPHEAAADRHLWIFGVLVGKPPKPGKTAKKPQRAAYVKIQFGYEPMQAICISFHRPKHQLSFPFSSIYQLEFDTIYHAKP